jgi:DNA-binding MarR family transcriptional regulator
MVHDERRPIGFWLRLVDRLIDEAFAETIEEHGVTRRQWQLLSQLGADPVPLEDLARRLAPLAADSETTTEDELRELIESDWVRTETTGLVLTDTGTVAFGRLAERVTALRGRAAEGIDAAEYNRVVETLERMARNLGWAD